MKRLFTTVMASAILATPAVAQTGCAAISPQLAARAVPVIHYKSMAVDGVKVFYREAGPADAPVLLLLHGFPTSSHMFRNLIPLLADRYHVIAPDYPGYGQSDAPDHAQFAYVRAQQAAKAAA